MTTIVILASGPSMSQAIADQVRAALPAICVADAYRLAPWALALVANDRKWWEQHPAAGKFAGRKFCGVRYPGTERLARTWACPPGVNSGMKACDVAQREFGATRILLCGFDMRGSHFFGPHPAPLANSTEAKFQTMIRQFRRWRGAQIVNCTPGSALTQFPIADLDEALHP